MPRKQRGLRRSRRRNAGRRIVTTKVAFHGIGTVTLVAGQATISCAPTAAFSNRLTTIGDCFDEYRLTAFKYRIREDITTPANTAAMAFYPGVTTTPPNNQAQIGTNPFCSLREGTDNVMPPYVHVPRGVLAGEQPWYKSQKASLANDDALPGQVYFIGTTTDVLQFEWDGVMEFRGEAETANTPLERLLEQQKQIEQLLPLAAEKEHRIKMGKRQALLELLNYSESCTETRWPETSPAKTGQMALPGKKLPR